MAIIFGWHSVFRSSQPSLRLQRVNSHRRLYRDPSIFQTPLLLGPYCISDFPYVYSRNFIEDLPQRRKDSSSQPPLQFWDIECMDWLIFKKNLWLKIIAKPQVRFLVMRPKLPTLYILSYTLVGYTPISLLGIPLFTRYFHKSSLSKW